MPAALTETSPVATKTAVDVLVERLARRGVRHIFGVPGGDCNLDVIESASRAGIPFILTRTETAAAISAAVAGELTGSIGVAMTTRGPGLANGANGVAYASLDRAPLLLLADHYDADLDFVTHQRIDQAAMLRPVLRGEGRLDGTEGQADVEALLDLTLRQPPGPVYLEITGKGVRAPASDEPGTGKAEPVDAAPDPVALASARSLLAKSSRPVIIAGLQACDAKAASALRALAERWRCPVFATYKAKGVVSDASPYATGCYIGGAAEEPTIRSADVIVLYGFDAIEGPPQRWRYSAPVIEVTRHPFAPRLLDATVSLVGNLDAAAHAIADAMSPGAWTPDQLSATRRALRERAAASDGGPIPPQMVVEEAIRAAPRNARITVDAGAHMLPVMHLWPCDEPRQVLISRGLATMGFALPAAIGSAFADPDRPVIAFTGDGGLMMCAGELGTAAQYGRRIVVVVFNDSSLTLIGAKQRRRQLPNAGVDLSPANFATVATGFGCLGYRVERPEQLAPALAAALAADRPAVVDVVVNPHSYHSQIISLRG
jgi:acetolactate synthase-1/2/3 large subunit